MHEGLTVMIRDIKVRSILFCEDSIAILSPRLVCKTVRGVLLYKNIPESDQSEITKLSPSQG